MKLLKKQGLNATAKFFDFAKNTMFDTELVPLHTLIYGDNPSSFPRRRESSLHKLGCEEVLVPSKAK